MQMGLVRQTCLDTSSKTDVNALAASSTSQAKPGDGRIHFGADASSDHEGEAPGDDNEVEEGDEGGEGGEGGEEDEDEPEDDFNAAWDVLDLARAYYDKQEGDDMKLKLSEAYMSLGDVSLETGTFNLQPF